MIELPTEAVEEYITTNVNCLKKVVKENNITALHANHAVLMSVVAQRVSTGSFFNKKLF
jgi:hypothetical protein